MKRDEVREYLNCLRKSNKQKREIVLSLDILNDEIDTIRGLQSRWVASVSEGRSNDISDPTYKKAQKIVDEYSQTIEEKLQEIIVIDAEIEQFIYELDGYKKDGTLNENEYNVLKYYYVNGMGISEVALAMNYSIDWVKRLKADAIKKIL